MHLINDDVNTTLLKYEDGSVNLMLGDPPYALGNKVYIRPDGKPDYKNSKDFMNHWDMPDGYYWETFFKESMRVLKYGGYLLLFGVDRNLMLFKYYATLAGFEEVQSLYWYFTSALPKSSKLASLIDKRFDLVGDIVEIRKSSVTDSGSGIYNRNRGRTVLPKSFAVRGLVHPIARKYDGYRYAIAPFKANNETIMVFRKPFKTSMIDDVIDLENGAQDINCAAINIEASRASDDRYPAQSFIEKGMTIPNAVKGVLHECSFERMDFEPYIANTKVGEAERNAGVVNNHTTLKPIDLIAKVGKLFKTPGRQSVLVPFAGTGSEMIGLFKAGFSDITGIEINKDFADVAKIRINYWTDLFTNKGQSSLF